MCIFFAERLNAHPGLRIAAALTSSRETRSMPGSLLVQPAERFRLPSINQAGYEFPIAREIASNWWGVGCRIGGENGHYFEEGVSFALGLAWAKSYTNNKSFAALLGWYEERMVPTISLGKNEFRPGERSIGAGMVLYRALAKNAELWKVLQQLTAECWGKFSPEEEVVARLRGGGFPTEDFSRKRFHRD